MESLEVRLLLSSRNSYITFVASSVYLM